MTPLTAHEVREIFNQPDPTAREATDLLKKRLPTRNTAHMRFTFFV